MRSTCAPLRELTSAWWGAVTFRAHPAPSRCAVVTPVRLRAPSQVTSSIYIVVVVVFVVIDVVVVDGVVVVGVLVC